MDEILQALRNIEKLALIGAKNVLTLTEAAYYLGISEDRVYHLVCSKDIPCYKKHRRAIYFKKTELEEWMLQNRQKSNEEIEAEAIRYCITHK